MTCPWIHCNICLRLPSANVRYFISNCGHIACNSCVEKKLLAPKCYICKRDAKVEEINKNLRDDLRKYFVNIADFARKSFNEVKAVIEFQTKNTRRLLKYKMERIQELQNTTVKHSEDSATIAKLQKEVEELQARNRELEIENQNLNSSFVNQQTLVNQLLSNNGSNMMNATSTMNITPSFLQGSMNGNITQHDLFNLINASYLNSTLTSKRNDESALQESVVSPHELALDQSSLNFGQSNFNLTSRSHLMERILAQSTQRSNLPDRSTSAGASITPRQAFSTLRPTQQQIAETLRTPSNAPVLEARHVSSLRPTPKQISEALRTPSRAPVPEPRHVSSVPPSQRLPDAIASKPRCQTDKISYSSRSEGAFRNDNMSMLSTKTSRSAPSQSSLFKAPVVVARSSSSINVRTPQGLPPPSQYRSRTVCPHWPRARCRCNK